MTLPKRFDPAKVVAVILAIVLVLAWSTVWQRNVEIRELEAQLETAQADAAELNGDMEDMKLQGEYFRVYSFQVVMGTLIKKARQYKVPINTALALAQIESAWNPFAISSTGDYGLYQLNEKAQKFDKKKIFIPEYNIDLGLRYLQKCYNEAGSWSMAVALYNAGKNYEISEHPRKLSESIFMR
jgi:soluble lytic murein transglycosylase-like protein